MGETETNLTMENTKGNEKITDLQQLLSKEKRVKDRWIERYSLQLFMLFTILRALGMKIKLKSTLS